MYVQMELHKIIISEMQDQQIIVLKEVDGDRKFPIVIGSSEAYAIDRRLKGYKKARPMTHDLIKNILETIEARVQKVVVTDLKENTFYAVLHLQVGTTEYTVDARPSDAIALALRVGAPIYVDEEVVRKAKSLEVGKEAEAVKADDPDRLREWLQNIKPEDFEKFNKT